MKVQSNIGIISYGTYLPTTVVTASEIGAAHGGDGVQGKLLGVKQKTVAAIDEDTITMATQAGCSALENWRGVQSVEEFAQERSTIGALFIGSESHPYAVKPSGTVVKTALGLPDNVALADLQFACKAGTQALQIGLSYVQAGMVTAALAVGADTAQSRPGDVLEFTAAAGAAAYLIGRESEKKSAGAHRVIARCVGTSSIATDTPDFWRRPGEPYPEHAGRFSGEPGYFAHITRAAQSIMKELQLQPKDFSWCVFHTPNGKFPKAVAQKLGFTAEQLAPSLVVHEIGNTYAAASLLALAAVLDRAQPGQKILAVSYGSGSGADAFVFETTPALLTFRKTQRSTLHSSLEHLHPISYQSYQSSHEGKH